jgi:hypothetical protein
MHWNLSDSKHDDWQEVVMRGLSTLVLSAILALTAKSMSAHEHDQNTLQSTPTLQDQASSMSCLCFQVCSTIFGKGQLVRQAPQLIANCKVLDGAVIGANMKNCACPDIPLFTDPTSPNH